MDGQTVVVVMIEGLFYCVETPENRQPCAEQEEGEVYTLDTLLGKGMVQCSGCGLVIQGSPSDDEHS